MNRMLSLTTLVLSLSMANEAGASTTLAYFLDGTNSLDNHITGGLQAEIVYNGSWSGLSTRNDYPVIGDSTDNYWMHNGANSTNKGNITQAIADGTTGLISFKLTLDPQQDVSFDSFSFNYALCNTGNTDSSRAGSYALFYRVNDETGNLISTNWTYIGGLGGQNIVTPSGTNDLGNQTVDLSGLSIASGASTVEFGILFRDTTDDTKVRHIISNVSITGTVANIPEPSTAMLGLLGLSCVLVKRRRRSS